MEQREPLRGGFGRSPLVCVVGPTASGKSALAIQLAQRWGAEVISVDASQVYRGLNIGTAKITTEEMRGVPHHLIDCVEPDESFDVARFCKEAERLISECFARKTPVILCGGTGLYFKALLFGLCEAPPISAEVKERLDDRIRAGEVEDLHRELMEVDPHAAQRIMPRDKQRVERALGVYLTTGVPLSVAQAKHGFKLQRFPTYMVGIDHPRDLLNHRIEQRVELMFEGGFIEEVKALKEAGYAAQLQSMSAIGYRLMLAVLDGQLSLEDARQKTIFATRQYARRQRRYFNKQLPTQWIEPPINYEQVFKKVDELWGLLYTRPELF